MDTIRSASISRYPCAIVSMFGPEIPSANLIYWLLEILPSSSPAIVLFCFVLFCIFSKEICHKFTKECRINVEKSKNDSSLWESLASQVLRARRNFPFSPEPIFIQLLMEPDWIMQRLNQPWFVVWNPRKLFWDNLSSTGIWSKSYLRFFETPEVGIIGIFILFKYENNLEPHCSYQWH